MDRFILTLSAADLTRAIYALNDVATNAEASGCFKVAAFDRELSARLREAYRLQKAEYDRATVAAWKEGDHARKNQA